MKQLVTASRVRSVLADARTEKDAADILRAHRIRYGYSTAGGMLHIAIPARSGTIRVYRVACQTAPLAISATHSATVRPSWPFRFIPC